MSSAAYNRLHGLFKNTATATATTTGTNSATSTTKKTIKEKTKRPKKSPTTSTPPATAASTAVSRPKKEKMTFEPLPMSQLTTSLANLKMFIDTFKRTSNTGPFRYSYKYYDDVVSHLARSKQHAYIEEILEHQKRYATDMTKEPFVVRLISLYGKSRMFDHARKVFDEMPQRNCPRTVLSANALLAACVNSKKLDKIPDLFREIREELSIEPDEVSYNVVVKAFCEMDDVDSALRVADEMEKNGCECNLYTYNTIVDALYGKGNVTDGDKIWDAMKGKNIDPDVRTYNAKVRGLVLANRITDAVGLIDEMKTNGVGPDVYTYNGLIHGFVKGDDLAGVKRWYEEMLANGVVPDSVTYRIMIPFATKKGDFGFGFELGKAGLVRKMNVGKVNLQGVVDGLVKEGAIDEAKELVELVKGSDFIYYKLELGVVDS